MFNTKKSHNSEVIKMYYLYSFNKIVKLWADKGRPGISCVYVKPDSFFLTNQTQLLEVVKGTYCCSTQRGTHLEASKFLYSVIKVLYVIGPTEMFHLSIVQN